MSSLFPICHPTTVPPILAHSPELQFSAFARKWAPAKLIIFVESNKCTAINLLRQREIVVFPTSSHRNYMIPVGLSRCNFVSADMDLNYWPIICWRTHGRPFHDLMHCIHSFAPAPTTRKRTISRNCQAYLPIPYIICIGSGLNGLERSQPWQTVAIWAQ